MADIDSSQGFVFADHLILDNSPTREYFEKLLQGLIHKNNNFLGVIQGFSSLILLEDRLSKSVRDSVLQMKESAHQSTQLAKVLVPLSGSAYPVFDETDINASFPHVEQMAQELCDEQGVTLKLNRPGGLPIIQADLGRLNEVFRHLVTNAVESASAMSPKGEVAIDVFPPGDAFEGKAINVFIRNSSVDIPTEDIISLYEPFNGTKGNDHEGNGLTVAAILAGQLDMRLGFRNADGTTTVWLNMPVEDLSY